MSSILEQIFHSSFLCSRLFKILLIDPITIVLCLIVRWKTNIHKQIDVLITENTCSILSMSYWYYSHSRDVSTNYSTNIGGLIWFLHLESYFYFSFLLVHDRIYVLIWTEWTRLVLKEVDLWWPQNVTIIINLLI